MKTCSVCGESKPESEYYRQKIRGKGYEYSFCIPCKNAKAKDYAKRTGRATASFTPGEVALMALVLNEMAGEAVGQTSSFSSVREKFTRMLSKAQKEGNEE